MPVGFTTFPGEIWASPRSWVEAAYPDLAYFNEVDRGGHFAAWEEPELFSTEIRAAFRPLRQMSVFERVHMPSLGGATEWLNSEPLDPAGLRGQVVLVNFWTLDLHQLAAPGALRPRVVAWGAAMTGWS